MKTLSTDQMRRLEGGCFFCVATGPRQKPTEKPTSLVGSILRLLSL